MSEKLPRVTANDTIRALERAGFSFHDRVEATRYTRTKKARGQQFLIIQEKLFTLKFWQVFSEVLI